MFVLTNGFVFSLSMNLLYRTFFSFFSVGSKMWFFGAYEKYGVQQLPQKQKIFIANRNVAQTFENNWTERFF